MNFTFATCLRAPDPTPGDGLLAAELRSRGHQVQSIPWNASETEIFTAADAVVLRSNWDYHEDLPAFKGWLDTLKSADCRVINSNRLVEWNLDKSYLLGLENNGIRIPRTEILRGADAQSVARFISEAETARAVIKPLWGASGLGVEIVDAGSCANRLAQFDEQFRARPLLLQEYIPEIVRGETALVFFAGEFSHAFRKKPAAGEFRVNYRFGGNNEAVADIDSGLIEFGHDIIAVLPEVPVYARIDLVTQRGRPLLMEVELNEPSLGLQFDRHAARKFADAIFAPVAA